MGFNIKNNCLTEYIRDDEATDIVIPEGVTSISHYAFRELINAASITFPQSLPIISRLYWNDFNRLKRVFIPDGMKVGKGAFFMADSIVSNIPIQKWNSKSGVNKLQYAVNYLRQYKSGDPFFDSVNEQNELFIKEHTTEIVWLLSANDAHALAYLMKRDFLNIYHIEYLETTLCREIETTAMLLDYKSSHFSPEFLSEHEQKKIDTALGRRERSLSEWKRIFQLRDDGSGGYVITGYKGSETEIAIPEKIDGKQVTAIGYRAFSAMWFNRKNSREVFACEKIESVYIPEGVTQIEEEAFAYCSELSEVILPKTLKRIGKAAFSRCYDLAEITLPEGLTQIEEAAFFNSGITKLAIPSNIITINKFAFAECNKLKELVISSGLEAIGKSAFLNCTALTEAAIPEGVKSLGYEIFRGCSALTSVTLPESVTVIPAGVFYQCENLKEINLPDTLISIGKAAFKECTSLSKIVIPDSVTHISGCAFALCTSLSEIKLPATLQYLGRHAFYYCESLKSIVLSERITCLLKDCFKSCAEPEQTTLPDTLQSIGNFAFYACRSLAEITIPESVVQIGFLAFGNCDKLTISAPRGSCAIEYAKQNDIPYKEID